ncbi:flippase [Sphingobacterium sp. xlx-130]|uniref:flippase n=1 Tax=Sphingobacterium sp. xlx-130 TaxID=2654323 RepID=UPI0013DD676C|nr:flippase [Sphingobacterium sp. xlx-130]
MVKKRKLLENIASLSVVQMVNYVFPLITVPYVSRVIGPDGYGAINYATAFVAYFSLFIGYGFDLTGTRKIANNSSDMKTISQTVSEILLARILLCFISIALFLFSVHFFLPSQTDLKVTWILFVGCIANVISPQFLFQGLQELSIFAKLNLFRGVLNVILVFLLVRDYNDYYWLPVLTVCFNIAINVFLVIFSINRFKIKYSFVPLRQSLKLIINERIIFFSTVVISLYTTTNIVILGFFADVSQVGYYTTSQSFLNIVSTVITIPLTTALFPYIGRAFGESREEGLDVVRKILPIVFYGTLIASLFLLLLAPWCIRIIYGNEFEPSIAALRITAFLPFIICLSNIFGIQVMLNLKLDNVFLKTTLIACVIGVVFNIFMSKNFGYIGTAWSCLIVEAFVTSMMYLTLRSQGVEVVYGAYFKPKFLIFSFKRYLKK